VHEYSATELRKLFRLPLGLVRSLSRAGYTPPTLTTGKTAYGVQDLVVFRIASALYAARISTVKIIAALRELRATLPAGSVMSTLALGAAGSDVVVREGTARWGARAGQYAISLGVENSSSVVKLRRPVPPVQLALAEEHYARAHELEATDSHAARRAYMQALGAHGDHLESRINLGRLLHVGGQLEQAERIYREAKSTSALLSFNLGTLLEDLNRNEEAIAAYRDALAQDPELFDAHYNLYRLYEAAREPRYALQHLLAYRRKRMRRAD
jgi:tetratricopeptide (TPR) repeat protein